ncbi:precorrin-6A/cobalt-precorrin-6A reductase [Tistlia consotensis]|uniref:Precorrin-6A/cobalt-precorrin-6A reductase n=1 Tax=Tistlia consotensis USBA 355 TaxID=560819 RepID=A0A1Y6B690_9PROT|nr:cobalt-precorrin-6A reductase [Tistlia consotensis]SME92986.1 precorrin-6A/cobalt-precorrin-6A reductase [Tistlia consotensis USBA 355]SNR28372.1 precorrin-6A/cobalt-precorrin-6A reductase [Tistlia consotensis]
MARVLILGGTTEALRLAEAAVAAGHAVTTSLAGRTDSPRRPAGALRTGGFGGAEGLAEYLRGEAVERLLDATHPFAARIAANAAAAAEAAGVPRLKLLRPAWRPLDGDDWQPVASLEAAAAALPAGCRALLTIGRQELAPFLARADLTLVVRTIEPVENLPPNARLIRARGPFEPADETALLQAERIDRLVTKNAGGKAASAKLEAARRLGVAVVMVERPTPPAGPTVARVEAALAWLADTSR